MKRNLFRAAALQMASTLVDATETRTMFGGQANQS